MDDRWMDERDRAWRERDWRRSETYGRGGEDHGRSDAPRRGSEARSWPGAEGSPYEEPSRRRLVQHDEDYGERSYDRDL
jgi:hypothetical protein